MTTMFVLAMYIWAGVTVGYIWREYCHFAGIVGDLLEMPFKVTKEARSWSFAVAVGALWPVVVFCFLAGRRRVL